MASLAQNELITSFVVSLSIFTTAYWNSFADKWRFLTSFADKWGFYFRTVYHFRQQRYRKWFFHPTYAIAYL